MMDMPTPERTRDQSQRQSSIRTQLVTAMGLVLVLAFGVALIGYLNLRRLQNVVETQLLEAARLEELSLGVENEFLFARQNESNILTRWRQTGFDVEAAVNQTANENHLASANQLLDEMEQRAGSSSDPSLVSMVEEIATLRPQLKSYSEAFAATVTGINQRTNPEGSQVTLDEAFHRLEVTAANLADPKILLTLQAIKTNEANFYSSGRQEYVDNIRLLELKLVDQIIGVDPNKLEAAGVTRVELRGLAFAYREYFSVMVAQEQSIQVNSAVFLQITSEINQSVSRLRTKSAAGLTHAQTELDTINRQTSLTLLITTLLAMALGISSSVIMTRRIVRPINTLTDAAREFGRGQLEKKVTVSGSTEMATLGQVFNSMADQLRQTLAGLEQRVAERTQDLERRSTQLRVASEVARDATSTRQLDLLLSRAVELIRERFGFYHAGIFLTDASGEYAVLQAATGDAGRSMLERKHKLKIGEVGIVGRVVGSGKPLISLDVGTETAHFKNPLLPDTRSEMALPLKVGNQVIGALDVQSVESSAFTQDDVAVLQTMADQLAVAIDSARSYQEARESLQQLEELYGRMSKEAWQRIGRTEEILGYRYEPSGTTPIYRHQAANLQDESNLVTIPLVVRGQTIGSLDIWPEETELTPAEQAFMQNVADSIGQAMESARLFEEAQARALREQTLSQLTAHFTRSVGLETLLRTAVQELSRMPNVTEVSIHLGNEGHGGENGKDRQAIYE